MADKIKTELVEENVLIANRVPPGDRWRLAENTISRSL